MIICHVCRAECEDGAELCPICGAVLISSDQVSEDENTDTGAGDLADLIKNPMLAACVEDVVTAEIYRDILKENGIPFTCDTDDGETMKVVFGGSFVAEDIYVDESNIERAQQLYDEVLNAEPVFEDDSEVFLWEDEDGLPQDEEN